MRSTFSWASRGARFRAGYARSLWCASCLRSCVHPCEAAVVAEPRAGAMPARSLVGRRHVGPLRAPTARHGAVSRAGCGHIARGSLVQRSRGLTQVIGDDGHAAGTSTVTTVSGRRRRCARTSARLRPERRPPRPASRLPLPRDGSKPSRRWRVGKGRLDGRPALIPTRSRLPTLQASAGRYVLLDATTASRSWGPPFSSRILSSAPADEIIRSAAEPAWSPSRLRPMVARGTPARPSAREILVSAPTPAPREASGIPPPSRGNRLRSTWTPARTLAPPLLISMNAHGSADSGPSAPVCARAPTEIEAVTDLHGGWSPTCVPMRKPPASACRHAVVCRRVSYGVEDRHGATSTLVIVQGRATRSRTRRVSLGPVSLSVFRRGRDVGLAEPGAPVRTTPKSS